MTGAGGGSGSRPGGVERLLLLQPRWLGDVLLGTPAIRAARAAFPGARIDFATERAGGEALCHNPNLDEVLVAAGGWRSRLKLLRTVSVRRYDAVVDFRSTNSTAQIALASRAPRRIGLRGRGPRNAAYTKLLPRQDLATYAARHKLDMLAPLGVDTAAITDLSLDLPIGEAAHARADAIWREHALEGERVVAITPASREAYKQWGTARWAEIADRVTEMGARVLLTHGPGEERQAREVVAAMRHPVVWKLGRTTIDEVAAIFARCVLWMGNDGGSKHIAAAARIPTIAVTRWKIGPVWTDATSPVPQEYIDSEPPPGKPCDQRCTDCAERGCLLALGVGDVLPRVRTMIDG